MTQLVLPNTIDPGTALDAIEVQAIFVAIRDLINGGLEGGPGSDSNIKANGVSAREIADQVLAAQMRTALQAGVVGAGDFQITPGAGLALSYAGGTAWVPDTSSILSGVTGTLVPVVMASGGSVNVGANASGNPRIDQVILTMSDYGVGSVSVLQGTPSAGATLNNRTGAAALSPSSIRLADVLVTNGFAGPFVVATSLRDRRPWARGAFSSAKRTAGNVTTSSATYVGLGSGELAQRIETAGNPVRVTFRALAAATPAGASGAVMIYEGDAVSAPIDGLAAATAELGWALSSVANEATLVTFDYIFTPTAGSHLFFPSIKMTSGTSVTFYGTANDPQILAFEELVRPNANNGVA